MGVSGRRATILMVALFMVLATATGCAASGPDALIGKWTGTSEVYGATTYTQDVEVVFFKDHTLTTTLFNPGRLSGSVRWDASSIHDLPALTITYSDGPESGMPLVTYSWAVDGDQLLLAFTPGVAVTRANAQLTLTRAPN